jgi:pilus assembly protein CpaB
MKAARIVVRIDTTDILVAKGDINMGQVVSAQDIQWHVWPATATLELSPRQAETLAVSRQRGTLSLAMRSLIDANSPTVASPYEGKTANRRLNRVRFGVTTSATPK